jgi:outer membrane protein assembly factor BamB
MSNLTRLFLLLLVCSLLPLPAKAQRRQRQEERRQRQKRQKDKGQNLDNLPTVYLPLWQVDQEDTDRLPVTATTDRVYLPLVDGRIVALESKTGKYLWETATAGRLAAPLVVSSEQLLVTSKATDDSNTGKLRAINPQSGITLWTRDLPFFTIGPLAVDQQNIFAIGNDQKLHVFDQQGQQQWERELMATTKGQLLVTNTAIYVGSETAQLYKLDRQTGNVIWQFAATGAIRAKPFVDEVTEHLYVGDSDGYCYSLDANTGKQHWRWRTGAAIETTPQILGKTVIFTSFDNFVYALDAKRGDRIWKVRFSGRLSFDPLVQDNKLLITPLGDDQIFVLAANGKLLGQFSINAGRILAPPVVIDNNLYIVSDVSLTASQSQPILRVLDSIYTK